MNEVIIKYWNAGEGYSYEETFDNTEEKSAEAWFTGYKENNEVFDFFDSHSAIMVEIHDENGEKISEYWVEVDSLRERKYVIADCKKGDVFFEDLKANDREKAIEEFHATWNALSDYDKKQRDYFELLYAYDDGFADAIETAELVDKIV